MVRTLELYDQQKIFSDFWLRRKGKNKIVLLIQIQNEKHEQKRTILEVIMVEQACVDRQKELGLKKNTCTLTFLFLLNPFLISLPPS